MGDVVINGINATEVSQAEAALKALDFTGQQTVELEDGWNTDKATRDAIEKEFGVFFHLENSSITIFGKKASVNSAWDKLKAESKFEKRINVTPELLRTIQNQKLADSWKTSKANISVFQPPSSSKGSILVQGKTKADIEESVAKVEKFVADYSSEIMKPPAAPAEFVADIQKKRGWISRRFEEIK